MRKGKYSRYTPLVIIGLVVIGGGWLILSLTLNAATTTTASIEASSGTLSGCASNVADPTASGGQAVKFSMCASTGLGLDETGKTIPDTNYAIPSGAIFMSPTGSDSNPGTQAAPVLTINKAVALVPAGGTIVMRGGTYRDWYNSGGTSFGVITKSVTIQAYPHEQPWFDGTDIVPTAKWTSDGAGHWYMAWSTPSFCNGGYYTYSYTNQAAGNTGPCTHYDMYYTQASKSVFSAAGDPQMVFINGTAVHEVTSLAAATSGNFYYDWANKRIYIATNPSGNTVELAARPMAMQTNGAGTKVLGIGFKRFASNEYNNNTGVVLYSGAANQVFENDVFTQNAGGALGLYGGQVNQLVNHSVFAFNGFDGIEGNGHSTAGTADGLTIENSVINNNNTEGFGYFCSTSCSQAGMKLAHMNGYTTKNNIVTNNINAQGLWCDEDCSNAVMIYNVASNNGKSGIFYEISDTGIIASNLLVGNGSYGIGVGSADTQIYNNTLVNNAKGIWVYDDPRYSPGFLEGTQIGPNTIHISVVNNIISGSGESFRAQRSCIVTPPSTGPDTPGYFDAFDYNAYYRTGGSSQALISWLDTSTKGSTCPDYAIANTPYNSISAFTAAKGWDSHSSDVTSGGDPFFVDQASGNYNVRTNSSAYHSGAPIPTNVPAGFKQSVAGALGLTNNTGYSRGAITWVNN